jgi:basic amino acid/polyamine antiporter, APA family
VGALTATSLVVANMIGTGVFTSLGFQAEVLPSPFALLALWAIGGLVALCGALCYAELGATLPRSGGEYHFLSRIYHPAVGFVSGWISITVGFAAPIALASMALGAYLSTALRLPPPAAKGIATVAVILVSAIHMAGVRLGSWFQNLFTGAKVGLILAFTGCGFFLIPPLPVRVSPAISDLTLLFGPHFAISLVFVMYAYSGWNASAYIAGEMSDARRDIPRSLIAGTVLVTGLYILLNFAFLKTAPLAEVTGRLDVGFVSAGHIFGATGARIMGLLISLGLVSSVSAMTWVGPRVAKTIGEDIPFFSPLSRTTDAGAPWVASLLQLAIVLLLLLTSTFEAVLTYLGATLSLSTAFTVLGVYVLRMREPGLERPYHTWGYPVAPAIFLAVVGWMLAYIVAERPTESLWGLVTILAGFGAYAWSAATGSGRSPTS